jgi:hypothetical protein
MDSMDKKCNRGIASVNVITTDFNPLKRAATNKRAVSSADITNQCAGLASVK